MVRSPGIDRERHSRGNDVADSGLDLQPADRRDRAFDRGGGVANVEDVLGGGDQRVSARVHRDRAGVSGLAFEHALGAHHAHDVRHDAERRAGLFEHRSLLHVHLEEAAGKLAAPDEGGAATASALLVAEGDDRRVSDARHGLDCRDYPECPVELAPVRNGVEMRAGPDPRLADAADQVPGGIDLDCKPGLLHPSRREVVRALFPRASADAVGTRAAADRIQIVETCPDSRAPLTLFRHRRLYAAGPPATACVYRPNGLNALVPVETSTLFVSR